MRHLNVNSLIGACLEPTRVSIVNAYCNKGSLRDILQNRHVTMDKLFTTAFANDIAQVTNIAQITVT